MKKLLVLALLISGCSYKVTVVDVAKGNYVNGRVQFRTKTESKTITTNLYVKDTKVRQGDMVRMRKNKIIKIIKK